LRDDLMTLKAAQGFYHKTLEPVSKLRRLRRLYFIGHGLGGFGAGAREF